MFKGRKKKGATTETPVVEVEGNNMTAVAEAPPEAVAVADAPVAIVEEPPFEPSGWSPGRGERTEQFRSWVVDANGYQRLTDELHQKIVLKFGSKPDEGTLKALKDSGFRFEQSYFGQKNAWVRRNDFEGRVRVEELEAQMRAKDEPQR